MSLPCISIITVTYNAEKELESTIRSVLALDYPEIEYLVIDGGSTDGTLEIVKKYEERIDFFISEKDEGIYDAMNKGIRHARGEWLNFMNAGDTFASPEILTRLSDRFLNPETDIVCGDRYLLENGKKSLQKAKGIEDFWTKGSPCFHQSMFIRKRVMEKRGYDLCYKLSADYEFMLRSVVEGRVFDFVDEPVSVFLEGGASKRNVIRSQVEAIKILLDYTDDENIVKNNIFFQGLVRQNMPGPGKHGKSVSEKTKEILPGKKPGLLGKVESKGVPQGKILIVDPIFRGSRLFYSWITASFYAERGYAVDILSRTHAMTEQYHEYFDTVAHTLYDGITVPEDFWFGILTQKNVREILEKLQFLEERNRYDFIYFAGLNEHYPNLFTRLTEHPLASLKEKKMLFIEYDVRHLVKEKSYFEFNRLKRFAASVRRTLEAKRYSDRRKKVVFSFLDLYSKTRIGILDERIHDEKFSKILDSAHAKHFFYLPDPGPEILPLEKEVRTGEIEILIIGLQNRRKGLNQLVRFVERYGGRIPVRFHFVGKLTDETEQYRNFLKNSSWIEWDEGYFPEETIQRFYARSDYVFLPYTPDFTASSGVLAYATAFGKPVISTDHGLIGYKVEHYRLGFTYRYDHLKALKEIVAQLPSRESEAYRKLSENAKKYAGMHSIPEHQRTIWKVMNND